MKEKRIAIIGAGVSGLSAARILRSKGCSPVVFEKNDQPGGLIRCSSEEGNLFHHVGGIVFNTRNEKVKKWFFELFNIQKEFILHHRDAQIFTHGKYVGYPVENHLYQLPRKLSVKIGKELLKKTWDPDHASNFNDFLLHKFGKTLFEVYFQPYNEKIWNYDLKQIPLPWLEDKLPDPHTREILLNNLFRKAEKKMVHSAFYYPREGGSSFLANRLAEGSEIIYHTSVELMERTDNQWKIDGERFDAVIYTGDVRKLINSLGNTSPEIRESVKKIQHLPSNGTSNVLCYTDEIGLSWLYLPDREYRCHRIVYTGNFSPANNGNDQKTCLVEFSGKVDEAVMREQLKLLPGNLTPIAYNYEPDSYVIQLHDTRNKIAALKNHLEPLGFYLTGRFAEWEYYNMDIAMLSAMNVCDRFF